MALEILIVDDDPIGGGLTNTLLHEAGFETELISDSRKVLEILRERRPGLVILDILMPGIDGLTLCHMIKEDPVLRDTKVIMVSGKSFKAEKERALRYGSNLFIEKPYSIDTFAQQVIDVIGPPRSPRAASQPAGGPAAAALQVKVWGSRAAPEIGGIPRGKTPCVSVQTGSHLFVFDAGNGLLDLGAELLAGAGKKEVRLFLSHYHAAHVEGLGRFPVTRADGWQLHIFGPTDPDKSLQDAVREAFEASFAQERKPVAAKIELYELQEGQYDLLPQAKLVTFYANHPGTTLGFVLETEGRRVVYSPDCELYGESASAMQDYDEKLGHLCHGADLLIQDARWREGDYPAHKNEGHSSVASAVDFAVRHEVGQLLLFHADASYSDADLAAMESDAQAALKSRGSSLVCRVAREGLSLPL